MIINTGARTDTVQWYTSWLLQALRGGLRALAQPAVPQQGHPLSSSTPDKVDVHRCSARKDYAPILPRLREITDRFNTLLPVHHHRLRAATSSRSSRSIDELGRDALRPSEQDRGKPGASAWRYDPVLLTETPTPSPGTSRCSTTMCGRACRRTWIDACSRFVEIYKKLRHEHARAHAPHRGGHGRACRRAWGASPPRHGMRIQTCGTNGDWSRYGINP